MGVLRRASLCAWLTIAAALPGCGPGVQTPGALPGPGTARLPVIYDVSITYPSTEIIVAGLLYRGLDLDVAVTFEPASLLDGDPAFEAQATIVSVRAGGVPQTFEAPQVLNLRGTYQDGVLATGFFGPIRVGNAGLLIDLNGGATDDRRRVTGEAALFGFPDRGTFAAVKRRRYLVAGSDLQGPIGKASIVSVRYDILFEVQDGVETTSSDPIARVEDGRPFIVNRFTFDNLQGLDPQGTFLTIFEYSTENLSNPLDLVIPPPGSVDDVGTAFVTRNGAAFNDVAIVDLATGDIVDHIDLVPYARNRDHLPRPDQALFHDGLIYVTLQDADASFNEFMNGRVVIIDPVLRQVVQVLDLTGQNPFESLTYAASTGLIYVGLAGLFPGFNRPAPVLSGGIETIDPVTRTPQGLLADDDALGGNLSAFAITSTERGYCLVSDASFHNYVKAFDPGTGEVKETLYDSANFVSTIEADGDGYLLVADGNSLNPRILIFNAENGALVTALPVHVPPFSFAVLTRSLP